MSDETLRECPFCGGQGETTDEVTEDADWMVRCRTCDAIGGFFDTEGEAIAAWNRRVMCWPQGDEAAEQLAEAEYARYRQKHDIGWTWANLPHSMKAARIEDAAAVLARLQDAPEPDAEGGSDGRTAA